MKQQPDSSSLPSLTNYTVTTACSDEEKTNLLDTKSKCFKMIEIMEEKIAEIKAVYSGK